MIISYNNVYDLRLFGLPLTGISMLLAAAGGVLNCSFFEVIFTLVLSQTQLLPTLFIRH